MFIYNGKLDWQHYAVNESATFVFPIGFALGDEVHAYWQWTEGSHGSKKVNIYASGSIKSVNKLSEEYRFTIDTGYYSFEGSVASDFNSINLIMTKASEYKSDPMTFDLQYRDASTIPSSIVYVGKLNCLELAKNELVTLILPGGITNIGSESTACLFYQWSQDAQGVEKAPVRIVTQFTEVLQGQKGLTVKFDGPDYTYELEINTSTQEARLELLSSDDGQKKQGSGASLTLDHHWYDPKKALLVRFDTGEDHGIYKVQELLTTYLGFAKENIELLYFDVDSRDGPRKTTKGQKPPTAENFRNAFTELISSAKPGDVRFVYVDVHGRNDPNGLAWSSDRENKAWILAGPDDGSQPELIGPEWLSKTIRDNLKPGVNLTFIATAAIGSGMLENEKPLPGVIITGCDYKQWTVKPEQLHKKSHDLPVEIPGDPWAETIIDIITYRARLQRGVPSYSIIFNEAKNVIRGRRAAHLLGDYKGPSPDGGEVPIDDPKSLSSYQDPQLVFFGGYLNPDEQPFLAPLKDVATGVSLGELTQRAIKYPRDEYPQPWDI